MSIYGGFGTRNQEASYNKVLYNIAYLLQLKVVKLFRKEAFDDGTFEKYFKKFFLKLLQLEDNKYLPPKFTTALKDLSGYFGISEHSLDSMSVHSDTSNVSSQVPPRQCFQKYKALQGSIQSFKNIPKPPTSVPQKRAEVLRRSHEARISAPTQSSERKMRVSRQNQHFQRPTGETRMSRFSGQRSESRESSSRDDQVRLSNSMHFRGTHPHPPPPAGSFSSHPATGLGATSPPGRGQRKQAEENKSSKKLKAWGEDPMQSNPPNQKYTDLTQEQAAIVHNYGSHPPLQRIALKEPLGSQNTTINSQSVVININRNYNLTNSIIEQEAENQPDETEEQKQKKKKKKRQFQDSLEAASRYQGSSEIPSNAYEAIKPKKNLQQLNQEDIKIKSSNPRQAQSSYGVRKKGERKGQGEQLRSPSPMGGEYKGGMILASSAISGKTRKKYEQIEMMRSAEFSREAKRGQSPDFFEEARLRNLQTNPLVSLAQLQKALNMSSESATLPLDAHTEFQNDSQPSLDVHKRSERSAPINFSNSSSPFTAGGRVGAPDNLPALKSGKKNLSGQKKPAPRYNVYSHQSDSSSPVILPPGITRQNMKEPQRTSTAIGTRSKNLKLMYANIHPPSTADGKRVSFQNPQKLYQAMSEEEISAFAKSYQDHLKKPQVETKPSRKAQKKEEAKAQKEPILRMQDRSDSIPEQPDALGLVSGQNSQREVVQKQNETEEKTQEQEMKENREQAERQSEVPKKSPILEEVGDQSASLVNTSEPTHSQSNLQTPMKNEEELARPESEELVVYKSQGKKLQAAEEALDEAERLIEEGSMED